MTDKKNKDISNLSSSANERSTGGKPSLPQGTRDFGPDVVRKRQYILNTIKSVFELYGFVRRIWYTLPAMQADVYTRHKLTTTS